ncbi:hypothetical protein [Photobacterium halotolerans]|uniref:N-acetyltransferase domain-containing protein n=1 Tax=Photobacterium halotolerans TaxID=265726 RepID=A0A7X4WCA0_9GAMM|nr:hypothetical protein [Photobacterium halotolerans]NAW66141.1 hypothetical protein [Photobacterium halotolerans]
MKIIWLRPSRADFSYHLKQLKAAFEGSDNPKAEYQDMLANLQRGEASCYMVTGQGVRLRFVGRVIDGNYHIIAMAGHGLRQAASLIIDQCCKRRFQAITYHAYRDGMRRILNRFGFEQVDTVRQFADKAETLHQLALGGVYG